MKRTIKYFLIVGLSLTLSGCTALNTVSDILTILADDKQEVVKCEDCTKGKPCAGKWCVDGKWYQYEAVEIK